VKSFVAIDFETAQPARHSPCAIGMVKVVDGVITQRIFTLIRPPDNIYSPHNTNIHGIKSEHSENAPEFIYVYPMIKELIHKNHIVCHNASFDLDVLAKTKQFHGIEDDLEFSYSDTLELYGKSLDACCEICGIDLHHHDALSDAEACARLFLQYHKIPVNEYKPFGPTDNLPLFEDHGKLDHDMFTPELESVQNKNNPFYNKKVVITGVYQNWPDRNDLAKIIKNLGADIDSSVTPRTQILIVGANSGPVKLQKMKANIDDDKTRKIMSEEEVSAILKLMDIQ
jgi:DNA polymerase III subunit epsilon